MRKLNNSEIAIVAGGYDNKGYDFENLIFYTSLGGVLGGSFGAMTNDPSAVIPCAIIGAIVLGGYNLLMMVAVSFDNYYFYSNEPKLSTPTL